MTRNNWQLQLIDPQGKTWGLGDMGYASASGETNHVLHKIKEYLESDSCNRAGREFVLADVWQTLLNEGFHPYHCFRLVWGAIPKKEIKAHSQYPNGKEVDWHLVFVANGHIKECLSGSLPEGWWELDEDERQHQLQNVL
jgi:hypothetical protein